MRLEPLGEEGEGCEFWLKRKGVTEYHQVKRQHSSLNGWTIPELGRKGVLRAAFEKTSESTSRFVFVSSISAGGLEELVDPARKHVPLSEFKREFLKSSRKQAWEDLLREWKPFSETVLGECALHDNLAERCEALAYERLSRIVVRVVDETSLGEWLETQCSMLSTKNSMEMMNDIIAYALDHLMVELRADTMWEHLSSLGHRRAQYSKDGAVVEAVRVQNQRYEKLLEPTPGVSWIDRGEADDALKYLEGKDNKRAVLLSGQAGAGKSVALGQIIRRIRERAFPHLYFRIDRLDPEHLPERIGRQMNLPGSPVEVLAGLADGRTCVLIIDQLDAVSMVSGRNPDFFTCIHEIIRKVEVFPNMRLVLACRQFDLEKDNRLRELVAEKGIAQEIKIGLLTPEAVRQFLDCEGLDGKACPSSQVELLRLPLHLGMLLKVMDGRKDQPWKYLRAVDLFKAYWERKRAAVSERIKPKEAKWEATLDRLIDKMTSRQTLFAPTIVLDEYADTAKAMVSEGVLVEDNGRIGFFHEAFFDYCFARCFLRRGEDLRAFLKNGEQHLFKRAPLRQVIIHMQDSDEAESIRQVDLILADPDIRFHIKKAVLEVIGRIYIPSTVLWGMLSRLMDSPYVEIVREVQNIFVGNRYWFQFLNEKGILATWLADEAGGRREIGQRIVASCIAAYPDDSVALLKPYVGASPEWTRALIHALWTGEHTCIRVVFDLFMELIERDQFDYEQDKHAFWMCLHGLSTRRPEWAAKAIGLHLRRELAKVDVENLSSRMLDHDHSGEQHIARVEEGAPEAFLEEVLPQLISLVEQSAHKRDEGLLRDSVWGYRSYKETPSSMEESLLDACESALRRMAATSFPVFNKWVDRLWPYANYDTINYLIVRGFTMVVDKGADMAAEYFIEYPQRMECGWAVSGGGETAYWAARECIEHISLKCSDSHLSRLCAVMAGYFPKWERTADGHRERGNWQMVMLSAVDPSRRTEAVESRIGEWSRKYPHWSLKPPQPLNASLVDSPVPDTAARRMSDRHWLSAIRTYNTEDYRRPVHMLKGGAFQLSNELEKATAREPQRFALLACKFGTDIHTCYFDAIFRGLNEASAGGNEIYPVVRHFFSLTGKPGSRWLCGPIKKLREELIPDDILSIVGWLATESADPKTDELIIRTGNKGDRPSPHDLFNSAINCTRGAAAEAIEVLLMEDRGRVELFLPFLDRMVRDPSVIVRSTVAGAVLGLFKWDEIRALELFVQLCDTSCDELLATPEADRFIYHANYRHFDHLRPIIERMTCSNSKIIRENGAKHLALAQFHHDAAKTMTEQCLMGDESLRLGVARVAEANLFHNDCRSFCHPTLTRLFDDSAKAVRDEAANAFRRAEGRDLDSCRNLINYFTRSAAFEDNVEDLTWAMRRSTADLDEEILVVGDAVARAIADECASHRARLYREGEFISELVLRAYRKSHNVAFQSRCLDLIDRLLSLEACGIDKELETLER